MLLDLIYTAFLFYHIFHFRNGYSSFVIGNKYDREVDLEISQFFFRWLIKDVLITPARNLQHPKGQIRGWKKSCFQIKKKKKLVGPLPHTQFPWARVTQRCLLSAAAWTGFVSLPNCGSVTVTVGINVDSCPSGCNQCGSRFDNIICRTLTYSMLTFSLAAEMLHKPFS